MHCEHCGALALSLWRSFDDAGKATLICGECVDAEIDLRHVRSVN
jgi:hypothetical protein